MLSLPDGYAAPDGNPGPHRGRKCTRRRPDAVTGCWLDDDGCESLWPRPDRRECSAVRDQIVAGKVQRLNVRTFQRLEGNYDNHSNDGWTGNYSGTRPNLAGRCTRTWDKHSHNLFP